MQVEYVGKVLYEVIQKGSKFNFKHSPTKKWSLKKFFL